MDKMHIAVAGNIGSGKTTLTTLLAKHYRYTPHYESVDDNPYLNDFYKDMQRWSFNLQVYFLNSRFAQLIDLKEKGKPMIQDRTIYEDAYIFVNECMTGLSFAVMPATTSKSLHLPEQHISLSLQTRPLAFEGWVLQ